MYPDANCCFRVFFQAILQKTIDTKNNMSDLIFVAHANCIDDATILANQIEQQLNIKPIIVFKINPKNIAAGTF